MLVASKDTSPNIGGAQTTEQLAQICDIILQRQLFLISLNAPR